MDIMNFEIKEKIDIRSVTLIVLFILIFLCSLLSVSYSYYTTTAVDKTDFFIHNTTISCLNITKQSETVVLPSSAKPVANTTGLNDSTNTISGKYMISIKNNCSASLKYNIRFVPDSANQMNLNAIGIASASGNFISSNPTPNWPLQSYRLLGATVGSGSSIDQCYTTSTNAFWSDFGSANGLGGIDQRICPVFKGTQWTGDATIGYDSYKTIAASGTATWTFKFFIDAAEGGTAGSTLGKTFSGRFVVYTVN